jgi:hypothetical protein
MTMCQLEREGVKALIDAAVGSGTSVKVGKDGLWSHANPINVSARARSPSTVNVSTIRAAEDRCKSILEERTVIVRRACRLRLYVAMLLGADLEGAHSFAEASVRRIMIHDFQTAQQIDLGDEVATATNRMEFLLDTAETRLRDAALCGYVLWCESLNLLYTHCNR